MVAGVLITRLWQLFDSDIGQVVKFWVSIGFDITRKVDWFLLIDFEQGVRWYAFFTSYFIGLIILCYIILIFCRQSKYKALHIAAKVLLFFNIFRLISYWLFWSSIEFEILCTAIAMFLVLIVPKWRH